MLTAILRASSLVSNFAAVADAAERQAIEQKMRDDGRL
jgi:hypothetical protein